MTDTNFFYRNALRITAAIGGILFIPLLILYILATGGHLPNWVMDMLGLLFGPICQQVAANGYIGKFIDFVRDLIRGKSNPRTRAENIGLTVGLVAAIILSTASVALRCVPMCDLLGLALGSIALFISTPNAFGGLGNRIGRFIDYWRNNPLADKTKRSYASIFRGKSINYVLSVGVGLLLGLGLTALIMTTSTITLGILPAILVTLGTISSCASACGYLGRCFDFLLGDRTLPDILIEKMTQPICTTESSTTLAQRCTPENKGTVIGVGIGIGLAIIATSLVLTGIVTLPFFGIGLPKLALGLMLFISLTSAGGGIGNRLGYALQEPESLSQHKITENIKKPIENDTGYEVDGEIDVEDTLQEIALPLSQPLSSFPNFNSPKKEYIKIDIDTENYEADDEDEEHYAYMTWKEKKRTYSQQENSKPEKAWGDIRQKYRPEKTAFSSPLACSPPLISLKC